MKNKEGVTKVEMMEKVSAFCPLGKQWYCADLYMETRRFKRVPDYLDATEFLAGLGGQTLTIEQLVSKTFKAMRKWFANPGYLKVSASVGKGKHLPVVVSKEKGVKWEK